ncbi:MAG: addiction module protein [Polyangiaceae bacterium]
MGDPARKSNPDTTDGVDELDGEWTEEIDRRIQDTEAGGDQGTSWETVRARLKSKYGWS